MALDVKKGLGGVKLPVIPWGKLSKLSRVQKLLIAVGILGALWGCFVWFLYMPQTEKITKLRGDLDAAKTKAVPYLAPGLISNNLKVAERTVEAFDNLRDPVPRFEAFGDVPHAFFRPLADLEWAVTFLRFCVFAGQRLDGNSEQRLR